MVLPAPISKRSISHLPKYFGSNLPNVPKFNLNLPSPKYPIGGLIGSSCCYGTQFPVSWGTSMSSVVIRYWLLRTLATKIT